MPNNRNTAWGGAGGDGSVTLVSGSTATLTTLDAVTIRSSINPEFNVTHPTYGATGNGVTDDTAAIQAAIDACYNAGGGVVYFPPGTYLVTTLTRNWTIDRSVHLVGAGKFSTYLQKSGATTTPVINFSATIANTLITNSDIRDLAIRGTNVTGQHGIALDVTGRARLRNLDIRSCDRGISMLAGIEVEVEGTSIQNNVTGIYCRKTAQAGTPGSNFVKLTQTQITNNSSLGLDYGDGNSLILGPGTNFEQNGTAANTATGAIAIQSTVSAASKVDIFGAYFESNFGRTIQVLGPADFSLAKTIMVNDESNRSVYVNGANTVSLDSVLMAAGTVTAVSFGSLKIDSCRMSVAPIITLGTASDNISIVNCSSLGDIQAVKSFVITGTSAVPTNVPYNSVYVDSTDGSHLRFRDAAGTVHVITAVP